MSTFRDRDHAAVARLRDLLATYAEEAKSMTPSREKEVLVAYADMLNTCLADVPMFLLEEMFQKMFRVIFETTEINLMLVMERDRRVSQLEEQQQK